MTQANSSAEPHFRTYILVWLGQLVSLLGSGMTYFAIGIWVYLETGSATSFAFISVMASLPGILISPFAGAIADRYDRRKLMIIADTVAALSTLSIAVLFVNESLQLWHIYLAAIVGSSANAFQYPAYSSATTQLVPKKHLGRASGMAQAADAASVIIAPVLAGILVPRIGMAGIFALDFISFTVAVSIVLLVRFPPVPRSETSKTASTNIWQEVVLGWRYIREREGLFKTIAYFTGLNFAFAFANILLTPMVLAFANTEAVGAIQSLIGVGLLGGSLLMSIWGGPKQKIAICFLFGFIQALGMMIASVRPDIALISFGVAFIAFFGPIVNTSMRVLLQTKIAPDMQGRAFAFIRMFAQAAIPIAQLLAGPLADQIFEPLMAEGGALAPVFGPLIGTGPGRGMALIFLVCGFITLLMTLLAMSSARVRRLQTELPDHVPAEAPAGAVMEGA